MISERHRPRSRNGDASMASEERLRYLLKRVAADLEETQRRLGEAEARETEPIAIVGIGCRFPGGVRSPDELWRLLADGVDAISEIPVERGWGVDEFYDPDPDSGRRDTTHTRHGGFIDGIADFDADFFRISRREARAMDPQQRMLLEVAWEALERSGIDPLTLQNSRTGVFVGTNGQDYATLLSAAAEDVGGHALTGTAASAMSGRLSYTLGLVGPSVTIDTACSSSLVSTHLASQALRSRECSLALAGGISLMSIPAIFVASSRQSVLAHDGRARAFSADANGTSYAEGAGVLVLERLSDAHRLGHPVLAVLRGSAVNQDGRSSGMTAPNGPAQQRVIRDALDNARLSPRQVDAVEAHGTGTVLGDPIEAQALLSTYGQDRPADKPLWLGSLKSNLGHAQAAAGVAGLIKMVLALRNGVLPATLHVGTPTPHVDWAAGAVALLTESRPWQRVDQPRRAGVSSFGITGTNAHVIVEEAPPPPGPTAATATRTRPRAVVTGTVPWVLSAKSERALAEQAVRLKATLADRPDLDVADVGLSLATTRSTFDHRAVLLMDDREAFLNGLDAVIADRPHPGLVRGVTAEREKAAFVFPGYGAQWVGMGRELLERSPVFRDRVTECARAFEPHLDWSLLDVLRDVPGSPDLTRIDVLQPALFAMTVSLTELWRAFGVRPTSVVGHSQGEVAAACVAGYLSVEDGARVIALRSRLLRELSGGGATASILLPLERVRRGLERWGDRLAIAAVNSPTSIVVSGESDALDELVASVLQEGGRARRLPGLTNAAHSADVEPVRDRLVRGLEGLSPLASSELPLFSTVFGDRLDGTPLDGEYWYQNLRQPVEFERAARALLADGHDLFVEVGPHPVLLPGIRETAEDSGHDMATTGTLRRDEGVERFLTSLAEAHVAGARVDWSAAFDGLDARRVELPTYPFHRDRHWPSLDFWAAPESAQLPGTDVATEDSEFWGMVERQDLDELAGAIGIDGDIRLGDALPALSQWHQRRQVESQVDSWRYRISWRPLTTALPESLTGTWLVVAPTGHDADDLVLGLRRSGAQVHTLRTAPEDTRQVLAERLREDVGDSEVAGVLSLLALDERPHAEHPSVPAAVTGTLLLVQALGDAGLTAPLWCCTRGAVSVGRFEAPTSATQAQVWGLGRVAALEHADRWGGLIDLPESLDDRGVARVAGVLAGVDGEDQVAVRPSGVFLRRLTRANEGTGGQPWRPRGTVLITGGTGGVGADVARWAARQGAEHLMLVSRRGTRAPGAADLDAELRELGAEVTIAACDAADRAALGELLASIPERHPLTGVLHAAAVLDDGILDGLTPARFEAVLRAKVDAATNLHELTAGIELDAFVLFSSMAGTTGNAGQGNYAAANAFLDALAEQRRAKGLPATSIAWGAWAEHGLLAENPALVERMRRGGLDGMAPAAALTAFERAVAADQTVSTIADIDWARFAPAFGTVRPSPLLSDLPEARRALETEAPALSEQDQPESSAAPAMAGLPPNEQLRALLKLISVNAAAVLGHASPDAVTELRAFRDLGFDSLTAVEFRDRLAASTGLALPTSLVFDFPNPRTLAEELRTQLAGGTTSDPVVAPVAAGADTDEPIAIVAMGCRFPGGVRTPEELWELVASGRDAIGEFPSDRGWDLESLYDADPDREGRTYVREGGFVHDAGEFDPGLFGISPREALAMDPQQRLLLETAWEVFERAGIDATSLRGSRTGVFMGTNYQDYGALMMATAGVEGHLLTGNASSVLSGRISYTLGLEGPAVSVDTACSASLVALHLACQALRQDECSLALTGGVTVMSTPGIFVGFSRQRGLASDGRCKPFAAAADGTGWGEGTGLVLLERLSDARRNGHQVLAVVRGSAVNQDGASNGLTAPNGPSQQRVIRQALANARLTASEVDAVEAHGTGTTLGDPIEAQALLATYGQDRPADRPLWLGSVKSNIGHTQAAAGVAGVIKMVMALRNGVLPKTLHVDEPTPHVDWESGAVSVLAESRDWPETGGPRRAGVSAFGVSGTNAHLILEQAPAPEETPAEPDEHQGGVLPWTVSGRGEVALRAQASRLSTYTRDSRELRPVDIGYSLATTRAALDHRAVVLAHDHDDAARALDSLAGGHPDPSVVRGVAHDRAVVALLFTGQGTQRVGMGRGLYDTQRVYADAFDAVCAQFDGLLDRSLRELVFAEPGSPAERALDETRYAQAGLFALEVALFRLVESWGVTPDYLMGHSIGELVAAHVSGVLSLPDACVLVAARGRLMQAAPLTGAMVSIQASEDEVVGSLGEHVPLVEVAAVNGPSATVISGDADAVAAVAEHWRDAGRGTKRLRVSHAFHSAHMDGMLDEFRRVADGLAFDEPRIPVVSNLTGRIATSEELRSPDYWVRHVRGTVRFADGMRCLTDNGVTAYAELGPESVLAVLGRDCLDELGAPEAVVTSLLRRDRPEVETATRAAAELHVRGVAVDWGAVLAHRGGRRVDLPTYAFQRERYWPVAGEPSDVARASEGAPTSSESRFWQLVEEGNPRTVASTLRVEPGDSLDAVLPALSAWRRRDRERSVLDSWRYRIAWKPLPEGDARLRTGTWLLVMPDTGTGRRWSGPCVAALARHGVQVAEVAVRPDGVDRARLAELLVAVPDAVDGVLSLLALDAPDAASTLALAQALGDARIEAPLWCLTSGAVSVGRSDPLSNPVQSQVWGLGRVVGLEQPRRWGGLVDLPESPDERAASRLCAVLAGGAEDQVAVRASGTFARRLERAPMPGGTAGDGWRPSGTVLITGGTGGLGSVVARWVAGAGAEHVVLTSRRGADAPGAAALEAELTDLGATVTVAACDVADRVAMGELAARLTERGSPIRSVFHAAGAGQSTPLGDTTPEELADVLGAKVGGAVVLDELFDDDSLDAFVLFSSIAGVWGSSGQCGYAAANAFLDGIAEHRRARGLPATATAWGPWDSYSGMAVEDADALLRKHGLPPMDPDLAITALRRAITADETSVTVADVDWARFLPRFTFAGPSPLLEDLPDVRRLRAEQERTSAAVPAPTEDVTAQLRERLAAGTERDARRTLESMVLHAVSTVLGHSSPQAVEASRGFLELGVDSMTALEARDLLGVATGLRLPSTLLFDHPTPAKLVDHFLAELAPTMSDESEDDEVRRILEAIPVGRLREAGLLDALLGLARTEEPERDRQARVEESAIETMGVRGLVQLALGDADQRRTGDGEL
ncbi:type I polyketide synthase [Actinoalloteichus sp. AHMU CJ021]|uniref:type I polyketide synthase n=1 Tax=Actinoalloteichus sp. AHMU CJ021 TaxID=2072503 RepID=UPI003FCD9112